MCFKYICASIVVALTLAGCGGGGGAGTSPFGSSDSTASAASNLQISLSKSTVLDTDTAGVTATVTAVNANGATVSGVAISYKVSNGIYTQSTTTTDAAGQNTATIKLGSDLSNRTITITASDGTHSAVAYLAVTGAKVSATASSPVAPGANSSVTFYVLDAASNPMIGQTVEILTSTGVTATGTTNSSGAYTYSFTAPSTAGTFTVTGTSAGVSVSQDVLVQNSSTTVADSGTPTAKSMDISPTVVAVNSSGSTTNSSTVRVLFKSGNTALANVRVLFDLNGDSNSVGGTFSVNNVYTDSTGYATTSYIPGSVPSPTNGVTIRACYATTGLPSAVTCASDGSNAVTGTLTVTSQAVSVTIGSDENVYTDQSLIYYRRFVVQVVDAAGVAMSGVTVTPQLDLINYGKGYFALSSGTYSLAAKYSCVNEDTNRNSTLESGEDLNHSAALEPRQADAAVALDPTYSTNKTDSNGRVIFRVSYPRSSASWVKYSLNVAGSVNGSEGRTSWIEWAPYPASALSSSGAPAFVTSPYGVITTNTTLTADTTMPDGTVISNGTALAPCEYPY